MAQRMFSELFPPFKCTDRRLPSMCSLPLREGIPLVPLAARIPPGSVRNLFPARGRAGAGAALASEVSCVGSRLLLPHSGSCASPTNTVSKPRHRGGQCPDLGRSCSPSVPSAGVQQQEEGVPRAILHPKSAWTSCSSCWRMWLLFPVFCSTISVAFSDSLSALRGLWTEFLTRKRKCPWTDAGSFALLCPSPLAGSVGVHRKRFSFDSGNRRVHMCIKPCMMCCTVYKKGPL